MAAITQAVEPTNYHSETDNHYSDSTSHEFEQLESLLSHRYHIIRQVGKGAQGRVFLAETTDTHQQVAIKQLLIQSIKDWKLYDLFHREAETLQRIDVPGVAKLHEATEFLNIDTPMAVIIQDFIEGDPLQTFIAKGHRFRIDQIGEIMLQLTNIIEKLHKSDPPVIHRDLKPSNIILKYEAETATPSVHIIDFGAVANPQVKGGGSTVVGTYGYMSPEQLMGHALPQSDIYSLAIIAVYLMSGVPPESLEIEDFRVLIDPHLEHLPHEITTFLRAMLAPNVNERMADYNQIRQFFYAIRKQDFEAIPKAGKTQQPNIAIKYSLKDVTSYRQAGNIELWQDLSDTTPRSLPKELANTFRRQKYEIKKKLIVDEKTKTLVMLIIAFGAIGPLLALISDDKANILIGMMIMAIILLIMLIIVIICTLKNARKKSLLPYEKFIHFISYARKSMATVIRIEYQPLSNEAKLERGDKIATWTIRYSFNPPDDSSPDPIVYEFESKSLPSTLKEGDLIPILYQIRMDNNDEIVESMPYPVANCDKFQLAKKI